MRYALWVMSEVDQADRLLQELGIGHTADSREQPAGRVTGAASSSGSH